MMNDLRLMRRQTFHGLDGISVDHVKLASDLFALMRNLDGDATASILYQ